MALLNTGVLTISLLLGVSTLSSTTAGAAERNNAQAAAAANDGVVSSGSSDHSESDVINLVRRSYVPRFVGKRQEEPVQNSEDSNDSQNFEDESVIYELDNEVKSFVDYLDSMNNNDVKDETDGFDNYSEENNLDIGGDLNGNELEEVDYTKDEDDSEVETQEEKRYQPTFVGKRGRYNPMFVGKRYKPMFVGKRYKPMFVGKRYNPMFVGKRYNPMFVGKRYNPMFVGKRYNPMFVGKRYTPKFVGKRYQPTFVGKRYQPTFVGKRYQPTFVGKRYQPTFVGKRYTPYFVGKRDVSEQSEKDMIEKRSVTEGADEETTLNVRRKRSTSDENTDMYKRAWGHYSPWLNSAIESGQPTYKRFVAPEFIGRRDSLTSILSALESLSYIQDPTKSTSKRFEAPMFIGKRPYIPAFVGKRGPLRPMFVGKRGQFTSEMTPDNYGFSEQNLDWSNHPLAYGATPDLSLYSGRNGL